MENFTVVFLIFDTSNFRIDELKIEYKIKSLFSYINTKILKIRFN